MNRLKFTLFASVLMTAFLAFHKDCIGAEAAQEETTSLAEILGSERVLAMGYWRFSHDTLIYVASSREEKAMPHGKEGNPKQSVDESPLPVRRLAFYRKVNDKLVKIYEDEPTYLLLGVYPLRPVDGKILTMWMAPSTSAYKIYAYVDGKVKDVWGRATKTFPEIVDIDNDGQEEILITNMEWQIDEEGERVFAPDTVDVYKWTGESYTLVESVPWKDRLCDHIEESTPDRK